MTGKHPANLCPNLKDGKMSCHTCGVPSCSQADNNPLDSKDATLIAEIAKRVIAEMNK